MSHTPPDRSEAHHYLMKGRENKMRRKKTKNYNIRNEKGEIIEPMTVNR